jgi:hypothetical protein
MTALLHLYNAVLASDWVSNKEHSLLALVFIGPFQIINSHKLPQSFLQPRNTINIQTQIENAVERIAVVATVTARHS